MATPLAASYCETMLAWTVFTSIPSNEPVPGLCAFRSHSIKYPCWQAFDRVLVACQLVLLDVDSTHIGVICLRWSTHTDVDLDCTLATICSAPPHQLSKQKLDHFPLYLAGHRIGFVIMKGLYIDRCKVTGCVQSSSQRQRAIAQYASSVYMFLCCSCC